MLMGTVTVTTGNFYFNLCFIISYFQKVLEKVRSVFSMEYFK